MPSVVFVHGTGVRQSGYTQTLGALTNLVARLRPGLEVRGCFWGERFGARLAADGASIPAPGRSRGGRGDPLDGAPDDGDVDEVDAWWVLYHDPLAELQFAAPAASSWEPLPSPLALTTAEALADRAGAALSSALVRAAAAAAGLDQVLPEALTTVLSTPQARAGLNAVDEGGGLLLARAAVAESVRRACPDPDNGPALDGAARDDLVSVLAAQLDPDADSRGLSETVRRSLGRTGRLGWRLTGARALERRRASILKSNHSMPGDVLLYLARGGPIRDFVAEQITAAQPPVTLIGHSLGGIACMDLLVQRPGLEVDSLITVGSQAPLLYELGALPSLQHPEQLPSHFPSWTNVYDPRDLLAYVGEDVFPAKCRDAEVTGTQPFPWAHSGYWALTDFSQVLDEVLPRMPAAGARDSG
jgi:hypothetical protein